MTSRMRQSDVSTEDFLVLQDISTHGQELNDICGFRGFRQVILR